MHLIDKHMYPKNFFFAVILHGIDGRQSMLLDERRQNHKSGKSKSTVSKSKAPPETKGEQMEVDQPELVSTTTKPDAEMADQSHEAASEKAIKETTDVDMGDLVGKMSALQFVPSSVRFGRGGRKTGFARG